MYWGCCQGTHWVFFPQYLKQAGWKLKLHFFFLLRWVTTSKHKSFYCCWNIFKVVWLTASDTFTSMSHTQGYTFKIILWMKCGFCCESSKDNDVEDKCGARSPPSTTTHAQCLREPQQLGSIQLWWSRFHLESSHHPTWSRWGSLRCSGFPPATQHPLVPEMQRKPRLPKPPARITLAASTSRWSRAVLKQPPWPSLPLQAGFFHRAALLGPN